MPNNADYVGLHRHSTYSAMDGFGTAEQIRDRLIELGQNAMGLTDHGTSAGHPEFFRVFNASGLKLIPGTEFYHCEDMSVRGTKAETNQEEQRKTRASLPHLTVLALNQVGYRNLLALHRLSYREGFYYRPRIDWPAVIRHQEGLVVLTGCVGGQIARLINADKADVAHQWLAYLKHQIEHLYAEITPITGLDISERHCRVLWQMAEELQIPRIVTDDAHFPRPEDHAAEDTMTARATGTTVDAPDRKLRLPAECYHCSGEEIYARLRSVLPDADEMLLRVAMVRTTKLAERCEVEPPRASGPIFNIAAAFADMDPTQRTKWDQTPETLLRHWVEEGIAARMEAGEITSDIASPEWGVYQERARYEFEILRHHNFFNYFLVVADLVRWARAENILTVARGSCGGSLLCWYLGITEVDPIKHDLPVERFIGLHRKGLPDIDLDIDSRHRDRFYRFLTEKYGVDNCAQIAALSRFRARQALRDVTAAHNLPDEVLAEMLHLVPEAVSADEGLKDYGALTRLFAESARAQELLKEHPPLGLAAALEGQVRQASVHATGFVVDARPIHETFGVAGKPVDLPVVACDKDELERLGGLKIDLIASDTLAVIATVMEMLGRPATDTFRLPLDDAEVYQRLGEGRNAGVFQLQGAAAGRLLRDIQPRDYEDLLAIVALARPGPLQSGGAQQFIERRRWKRVGTGDWGEAPPHPMIDAILGGTYGVVVYQEQVMRLAREVGKLPWEDVEKIRKVISKSEGAKEMDAYRDRYLAGATVQGIPENEALLVWEQCQRAGGYLFNRGHGADYAKIAGWTAYLKFHHPALFAAAFARFADTEDKQHQAQRVFNEFRALGGTFELIDPNRSHDHFTPLDGTSILGGFQDLDGCGPKTAAKLLAGQPYEDWDAFYRACPKTLRDRLYAVGLHEGRADQDAVLLVAPWFAEVTYTDLERAAAAKMGASTIADAHEGDGGEVKLVGRVTQVELVNVVAEAKKYGQRPPAPGEPTERAVVTFADETGTTLLQVSPHRLAQLMAQRAPFRGPHAGVGNSVYVLAEWNRTHTRLYVNDLICFREAPPFEPSTPDHLDPVKVKKTTTKKRSKKDDTGASGTGEATSESVVGHDRAGEAGDPGLGTAGGRDDHGLGGHAGAEGPGEPGPSPGGGPFTDRTGVWE